MSQNFFEEGCERNLKSYLVSWSSGFDFCLYICDWRSVSLNNFSFSNFCFCFDGTTFKMSKFDGNCFLILCLHIRTFNHY